MSKSLWSEFLWHDKKSSLPPFNTSFRPNGRRLCGDATDRGITGKRNDASASFRGKGFCVLPPIPLPPAYLSFLPTTIYPGRIPLVPTILPDCFSTDYLGGPQEEAEPTSLVHNVTGIESPGGGRVEVAYYAESNRADRVRLYRDAEGRELEVAYGPGESFAQWRGGRCFQEVRYTAGGDVSCVRVREGRFGEPLGFESGFMHRAWSSEGIASTPEQWEGLEQAQGEADGMGAVAASFGPGDVYEAWGWSWPEVGMSNEITRVVLGVRARAPAPVRIQSSTGGVDRSWQSDTLGWVEAELTGGPWSWEELGALRVAVTRAAGAERGPVEIDALRLGVCYRYTGEEGLRAEDRLYYYDERHRVVGAVQGGAHTGLRYDEAGNLAGSEHADGAQWRFGYETNHHQRVRVVDPAGGVSRSVYDGRGNLVAQIDALGQRTQYRYDAYGTLSELIDPAGRRDTYVRDAEGVHVTELRRAGGRVTRMAYDTAGNLLRREEADGTVVSNAYNAAGALVAEWDTAGVHTTYAYDAAGNLTSRVVGADTPLAQTNRFWYDQLGRLIAESDGEGARRSYAYDVEGNREVETDALGQLTRHEYDAYGRRVATVDPAGGRSEVVYDGRGNPIAETDARGHTSSATYDAANRLVHRTDALGNQERYTYDANGNVIEQVSLAVPCGVCSNAPIELVRRTEYDALNRPVEEQVGAGRADMRRTRTRYDASGARVEVIVWPAKIIRGETVR